VPDTLNGRFDMLSAVMALVLLRLERAGEAARGPAVLLTEIFVEDMDGSLRQIGIGEYVVGKHVGRLMGALGGRLAAFRAAEGGSLADPVRRNIFHDAPSSD
jgi:cytochrome b pre-mRNA-processing protein 3